MIVIRLFPGEEMTVKFEIAFAKSARIAGGVAVLLKTIEAKHAAGADIADPDDVLSKATRVAKFTGKSLRSLDVVAPHGSPADRILVLGMGDGAGLSDHDWMKAGGAAAAKIKSADKVTIFIDAPGLEVSGKAAANFALGMELNAYSFDTYKTTKADDDQKAAAKPIKVTIVTAAVIAAKKAAVASQAVAEGVVLARNLVNEPANVLGPLEFAAKAKELEKLGVEVEILTEREMKKLGMGALLGVAQGSVRPPRLAIMQWKGGRPKDRADRLHRQGRRVRYRAASRSSRRPAWRT